MEEEDCFYPDEDWPILSIEMQPRPPEEYARSVPADYDGDGFWEWDGKRYVWVE